LLYTGLGAQEGQLGLEAGADDYLVKPAPLELLNRKARKLLERAGWVGLGEGGLVVQEAGARGGSLENLPAPPGNISQPIAPAVGRGRDTP